MDAFAASSFGADDSAKKYEESHHCYNSIMVKVFVEVLHERACKEFWGYASDESLSNSQVIKEVYTGIRLAPCYCACSEYREKTTLW
jgi:5-methyltetrahydrofolate--homocysteine methyltransferase